MLMYSPQDMHSLRGVGSKHALHHQQDRPSQNCNWVQETRTDQKAPTCSTCRAKASQG